MKLFSNTYLSKHMWMKKYENVWLASLQVVHENLLEVALLCYFGVGGNLKYN